MRASSGLQLVHTATAARTALQHLIGLRDGRGGPAEHNYNMFKEG